MRVSNTTTEARFLYCKMMGEEFPPPPKRGRCLPLVVFRARTTDLKLAGETRQVWERLKIFQEEVENVLRQRDVWNNLPSLAKD